MSLATTSIAAAATMALACAACDRAPPPRGASIGDAERGRALVRAYGCHTCHEIPGIRAADATVGPSLARVGVRVYAGGRLNTPANLVEFLLNPRVSDPHSPMPAVGLSVPDAQDVAAFLYTLR